MPDRSREIEAPEGGTLDDFLGHGLLPFVGRQRELERLAAFWESAQESTGMRCALLSGEAGIGKSRLIAELLRLPLFATAATIHVRLYPDSDSAPAPLLAHAIASMSADRPLRPAPPDGTIASVRDALRRLSNLRPTLVVIEDLHLLRGDALRDFAILLDVIAGYPITVLLAARPLDDAIRGALEPWIIEEITLAGLPPDAFRSLWQTLFGEAVSDSIVETIMRTTLGNPLALRSGLRGSLKAGVLGAGVVCSPDFALPRLARSLERQVQILSAGMTAHLDRSERDAALALASLGEVFAVETAESLLGGISVEIGDLVARGILIVGGSFRPPLTGSPGREPLLAFTHSLLHRELARLSRPDPERMIDILLAGLPLHSTIPFELLLQHAGRIEADAERISSAIGILLSEAMRLNQTSDWALGEQLWRTAAGLLESCLHGAPHESALRAAVITTRLTILSRDITSEEHRLLVEELDEITRQATGEQMECFRLDLLRFRLWRQFRDDACSASAILDEAERLVEQSPWLAGTESFVLYLRDFSNMVSTRGEIEPARRVERWLERITTLPGISEEHRKLALEEIAPNLFWFFLTPEELEGRLALIARVESVASSGNIAVGMWKTMLLEKIGRIDDAVAEAERLLPRLQANGQTYLHHVFRFQKIIAGAARGAPLDPIEQNLRTMLADAPESIRSRLRTGVGLRIVTMSLLRGEVARACRATEELLDGRTLWGVHKVLMELASERFDRSSPSMFEGDDIHTTIAAAARLDSPDDAVRDAAVAEVAGYLREPILRTDDILVLHAIVGVIDRVFPPDAAKPTSGRSDLEGMIEQGIERAMEWLAAARLPGYMTPLLDRFADHFAPGAADRWRDAIARMTESKGSKKTESRRCLTMLGSIEIDVGNGAPVALRTGRLRTLAGVLVADRMLRRPLSHMEFCRLIAGPEATPEQARKGMNLAVHRFRELIGHDLIDTTGETPRLVVDRIEVDLLEAHRLLELAERMIVEGHDARARVALRSVLAIVDGEVAFPGLYDNFFEASREDFEQRLRSSVLSLATRLLREGEIDGSEELLRAAFESMPEDGEIASLLCDTMITQGNRADAERVRMRLGSV